MKPAARPGDPGRGFSRSLSGLLPLLMSAGLAWGAETDLPPGRGALLPLQDRVGEPRLAELTETLLKQELGESRDLAETADGRTVVRRLRIRDASNEPPDRLAVLADGLGAEWFFLATLHEAREGRESRRDDGGLGRSLSNDSGGETPQLVLSARVIRRGSAELWWAGFVATSGRDHERAFGVGEVATLEELLEDAIQNLVAEAAGPRVARPWPHLRHRETGYLRAANTPSPPARIAVIPMDSVAELAPGASAEIATAALFATLDDFGFQALLPGLVRAVRQEIGQLQHGGASRSEWEALAREGGAGWVATGTVETYRRGFGRDPDPWVAFAVRFLDANDGRIDWLDGLERTGRETATVFDRGRIYSSGGLTFEMMRSMFTRMQDGSGTAAASPGD